MQCEEAALAINQGKSYLGCRLVADQQPAPLSIPNANQWPLLLPSTHLDEGHEHVCAYCLIKLVVLVTRHEALWAEGVRLLVHVMCPLQSMISCNA